MQYYIYQNNQQTGPFTEAEVKAKLASGEISASDNVWWEGQQSWVPLGQTALAGVVAPAAPVLAPPTPVPNQVVSIKQQTSGLAIASLVTSIVSTLTCGLLFLPAIILGHLGLSATKRPEVQGRGLAVAGLILGYVQLLIFCIVLLFFAAPVLALIGLGAAAKSQIEDAQAQLNSNSMNTPAQPTNSDQSTNSAPASTNSPDQTTNAPDSSTNSAPDNK